MRRAARWACAALLLLLVPQAHATDLTAKCTPPLTDTAGAPLPADEAITFKLYGAMQGSPLKLLTQTPLATCLSVRKNVTPGTACYAWTAFGSRGTSTAESPQTPQFCTVVQPPAVTPSSPTSPSAAPVTVATTVYMEVQVRDGFNFLAVGTVPLGTPCDGAQRVNNFNVVPTSAVTWTGSIHRLAALAACSVTN